MDERTGIDDEWLGGLEELRVDECLRLLRSGVLGRVGLQAEGHPVIVPVNYAVVENAVVLRTAPGVKLAAALARTEVAFEVDGVEDDGARGWSVLVIGHATELRDAGSLEEARRLAISPWAPGEREHYVAIPIERVTGRRFGGAPDAA